MEVTLSREAWEFVSSSLEARAKTLDAAALEDVDPVEKTGMASELRRLAAEIERQAAA